MFTLGRGASSKYSKRKESYAGAQVLVCEVHGMNMQQNLMHWFLSFFISSALCLYTVPSGLWQLFWVHFHSICTYKTTMSFSSRVSFFFFLGWLLLWCLWSWTNWALSCPLLGRHDESSLASPFFHPIPIFFMGLRSTPFFEDSYFGDKWWMPFSAYSISQHWTSSVFALYVPSCLVIIVHWC